MSQPETVPAVTAKHVEAITIEQAIDKFLADIGAGHSPATVRTYRVALGRLCLYLKDYLEIDPATCQANQLDPQWAIDCVRWISNGQPAKKASGHENGTHNGAIDSNSARVKTPKTTIATYVAGFSRFYKWCALERLISLPSDEYERMTLRFKDLRGKISRTILDKVPGDDVIAALLQAARDSGTINSSVSDILEDSQRKAGPVEDGKTGEQGKETEAENASSKNRYRGDKAKLAEQDRLRHTLIRLRNIALLETLKSTGARVSEIVSLTRGDLDATNRRARVVGKGSKERWIYFSQAAWEAVQEYLRERGKIMLGQASASEAADMESGGSLVQSDTRKRKGAARARSGELNQQPVFAAHHRGAGWKVVKPLTTDAIRKILWGLVEESGLEAHITPHKFRHWFATRMLSRTGDLAITQDLLGHANPATTRIYAQVSETAKQNRHREVFD
ncbi:MAG TPA: tyrosine-type recombinase/integrase [Chloroflexia bacterium]|nr:tyrosine-type recombinase/integrase [Chloroflexia bacterium]